jgi:hypothetical protein
MQMSGGFAIGHFPREQTGNRQLLFGACFRRDFVIAAIFSLITLVAGSFAA